MPLPLLEWRKLPTRTLGTTSSFSANFILENIYDMLTGSLYYDGSTRTVNSGSAWSASGKFTTGSNVEAVICRPPLNTVLSQSIIFSARSSNAPSSSATPFPGYPAELYSSSVVYVACVKNASGSFTEWTSRFPFGSGSYSTGYIVATNMFNTYSKLVLYESKEALCFQVLNNTINTSHAVLAGALIDPEEINATGSTDSENDGRIYAIATVGIPLSTPSSGIGGMNPTFLALTTPGNQGNFLSHDTSISTAASAYPRFIFMYPNVNATGSCLARKVFGVFTGLNTTYQQYTTLSGKIVQTPIYIQSWDTPPADYFLGRLREVTAIKNTPTNMTIRDSSNNIIGFTLGANEIGNMHTVSLNYR